MSHSMKKLRELSDDQLVKEHDIQAKNTHVGTQYYIDELNRRANERSWKESYDLSVETQRLAKRTYWQSWITVAATVVAVVISVIALNK